MQLVNCTTQDVALKEGLDYEAVVGIIDRYIATQVDWHELARLEVLGLDEVALKKDHLDKIASIWRVFAKVMPCFLLADLIS